MDFGGDGTLDSVTTGTEDSAEIDAIWISVHFGFDSLEEGLTQVSVDVNFGDTVFDRLAKRISGDTRRAVKDQGSVGKSMMDRGEAVII